MLQPSRNSAKLTLTPGLELHLDSPLTEEFMQILFIII